MSESRDFNNFLVEWLIGNLGVDEATIAQATKETNAEHSAAPDEDDLALSKALFYAVVASTPVIGIGALGEGLVELGIKILESSKPEIYNILVTLDLIEKRNLKLERIKNLLDNAEELLTEDRLKDLFKIAEWTSSKRTEALIAALSLSAPRMLESLREGELTISHPSPALPEAPNDWVRIVERIQDWISFTLPLRLASDHPTQTHAPVHYLNYVSGLLPDQSLTLAFRASDTFEAWGHIAQPAAHITTPLGTLSDEQDDPWMLTITPARSFGLARTADGIWHAHIDDRDSTPSGPGIIVGPGTPAARTVRVAYSPTPKDANPDVRIGSRTKDHLLIESMEAFAEISADMPKFTAGFQVLGCRAHVTPKTLGNETGLVMEIEAALTYDLEHGIRINGSGGAECVFVWDQKLGAGSAWSITAHSLRLVFDLSLANGLEDLIGYRLHMLTRISAVYSGLKVSIGGFGHWAGYWSDTGQDADAQVVGFTAPSSASISLDFGAIFSGGGFVSWLDYERDSYVGLIEVQFKAGSLSFGLFAYVAHETLDTGESSLLAALGLTFTPGLPIFFGMSIEGFGGLFGMNRRVDLDMLSGRLASGTVGFLLACPDPVANAPRLFRDIDAIFPPASGVFVVGPTARIRWGSFLTDMGFFFEFATDNRTYGTTGLTKILILGSATQVLKSPLSKSPALEMQVDVLGAYDVVRKLASIDMTIVKAKALSFISLTGSGLLRIGPRVFLVSVGGFHPDYDPAPAELPPMARLGACYDIKFAGLKAKFRYEFYFAVGYSGLQMGSLSEAKLALGSVLEASGFLSWDILLSLHPFAFQADIAAGFRFRIWGSTIAGVKVRGTLAVPPFTLSLRFSIELLWVFKISFRATWRFGDAKLHTTSTTIDVFDQTVQSINKTENWVCETDEEDSSVHRQSSGSLTIDPRGSLVWMQKRTPLDTLIERFEGQTLQTPIALQVTSTIEHEVVRGEYAAGVYLEQTNAQALSQATFEDLPTGMRMGFGVRRSQSTTAVAEVHEIWLRGPITPTRRSSSRFPPLIQDSVHGRNASLNTFDRDTSRAMAVSHEAWVVHASEVVATSSQTDAHQRVRHLGGVALPAHEPLVQLQGI